MIVAVRSNMPSFRYVEFKPGFNVILADRSKESTKRDSRNGLGKTTLIEIIHFCLGSRATPNQGLRIARLEGWSFTLDLNVNGRELSVTRSTDSPSRVTVTGDLDGLTTGNQSLSSPLNIRIRDWTSMLGTLWFGLDDDDSIASFRPTFRSLFSYIVRRRRDAFISPFKHHSSQKEWDKQVNNAFLLDLEWLHADQFQRLKNEEKLLADLRRAAQDGLLEGMVGTLGSLEAERARLDSDVQKQLESLQSFRVHPQYRQLEQESNELTATIHQLSNDSLLERRLTDLYRQSLELDEDPDASNVLAIYEAVGVAMPQLVKRHLTDVQDFHRQIVSNRRDYLEFEVQRLETERSRREAMIREAIDRRAELLRVLQSHGALQEFTELQRLHSRSIARRNDIDARIANLRRFERGRSEVRVKRELLLQLARREFEERRHARERAINLFNSNSQALYSAPGNLIIDIGSTGFKFDVDILRSGSHGIENMKIFCYDIMLAQLWARKRLSPWLLIHDSTVFDGVDERQVAHALELAQKEAGHWGFQYICALNSDTLPSRDFTPDFNLKGFVRLRLTDKSEEGCLLGIRY